MCRGGLGGWAARVVYKHPDYFKLFMVLDRLPAANVQLSRAGTVTAMNVVVEPELSNRFVMTPGKTPGCFRSSHVL